MNEGFLWYNFETLAEVREMIKAVFFDLDGTLLNSEKRVPDSAVEAIRSMREKGIKVYFASARSPRLDQTLNWTDREFSLFDGGIYCNGASVKMDGEMKSFYMDKGAVREITQIVSKYENVHLSLHAPDEGYAFNFKIDASMNKTWGLETAKVKDIDEDAMETCIKILVFYDHLTDSAVCLPKELTDEFTKKLSSRTRFYITDAGKAVQFSDRDVSKLSSIKHVQKKLGLTDDEISVFGDDVNDLEMISYYKNSVAMGNGAKIVKAKAGFITKDNDEDGIAYAVYRYLINQREETT